MLRHRPLLTRRELAVSATVAGVSALVPPAFARIVDPRALVGPGRFLDGVASGEPTHDAVTFWSRLRTDRPVSGAQLVVAEDAGMTRTVATAVVPTGRALDGALKVRVDGLKPGRHYWYTWTSAEDVSPVGRTKTAPAPGSRDTVRLGYSSCQSYTDGFFNAHRDAVGEDLDLYVFLGDYTYEYEEPEPTAAGRADVASVDLASYRTKLQLYRSDPDLRELHRLHPCVHIWDDHEVHNNYNEIGDALSAQQRSAGYRASFEWLPRMAFPDDRYRIYKTLKYGNTAEILLLDQRQYRTVAAGGRPPSMLGTTQQAWLKERLKASTARWKIIANQAMFAPLGVTQYVPVNPDQWDGYPDDRDDLERFIAEEGIDDVVFITGDIHMFMGNVIERGLTPIATEYVGGSVTSEGVPAALDGVAGPVIRAANPHIRWFGDSKRGWSSAVLTDGELRTTYRQSDPVVQGAPVTDLVRFRQDAGTPELDVNPSSRRVAPSRATPKPGSAWAARQARFQQVHDRDLARRAI